MEPMNALGACCNAREARNEKYLFVLVKSKRHLLNSNRTSTSHEPMQHKENNVDSEIYENVNR
jgi:hypothetical protein